MLFGTHMTQYHCAIHKDQMVLRLGLPTATMATLRDFRRRNPEASFVLCNAPADPDRGIALLSVPDLILPHPPKGHSDEPDCKGRVRPLARYCQHAWLGHRLWHRPCLAEAVVGIP